VLFFLPQLRFVSVQIKDIYADRFKEFEDSDQWQCGQPRRAKHLLKLKSGEITTLRQQLNGYRTAIARQQQKIQHLEKEIHDACERSGSDQHETLIDRILHDLNRNKKAHPSARCYIPDTIIWAREILSLSPAVYRMIHKILSVPSERFLE
jgi:exonuclease VII large subunit